MSSRIPTLVGSTLAMALFSGCSSLIKGDTPPSQVVTPEVFDAAAANPSSAPATAIGAWWRTWNDPQMSALIEQALATNTDIRTAQANLAAAKAQTAVADSVLYPTVSAGAVGGVAKVDWQDNNTWSNLAQPFNSAPPSAPAGNGYALGLAARWEADVFGGNRAGVDAAQAMAAIAEERLYGARVLVAAEVARNYREALTLRERLSILDKAISTAKELSRYTQARLATGQAATADVSSAQARQEELQAARPALQSQLDIRRRRLAVLQGLAPQQLPELAASTAVTPPAAPGGQLPSTVLERRPDVRARKWAVQVRVAQLQSLRAELLPSFDIVFLGGEGRLKFDGVPGISGTGGLVALRASLPLFNAGRLRANVNTGDALLQAAVADHDQAVLSALEDVESAYDMQTALRGRIGKLERSHSNSQQAVDSSLALFDAGQRTRESVLKARLDLAQADDTLAQARMQHAVTSIRLYQALGGGW
ncbi:TolC family protein [Cupriavidus basilensis]